MKIALINENSQKDKNEFIYKILNKVASKYGHEVYNYGVSNDKECSIDYVGAGILAGLLLNSKAVDFVITGCASGIGVTMSLNAMPEVYGGYIADNVDAKLFCKVNAGNAIAIPFGKYFGIGSEFLLEGIFETLFSTEFLSGYPLKRKEIQSSQKQELIHLKQTTQMAMSEILEELDREMLKKMIYNEYFEENFFKNCDNEFLGILVKNIFDEWESIEESELN